MTITTGIGEVSGSALSARSTVQPSMPGISTSRLITSGRFSRASRSASSPDAATSDAEALLLEAARDQLARRLVVVDDEHERRRTAGVRGARGGRPGAGASRARQSAAGGR